MRARIPRAMTLRERLATQSCIEDIAAEKPPTVMPTAVTVALQAAMDRIRVRARKVGPRW